MREVAHPYAEYVAQGPAHSLPFPLRLIQQRDPIVNHRLYDIANTTYMMHA